MINISSRYQSVYFVRIVNNEYLSDFKRGGKVGAYEMDHSIYRTVDEDRNEV